MANQQHTQLVGLAWSKKSTDVTSFDYGRMKKLHSVLYLQQPESSSTVVVLFDDLIRSPSDSAFQLKATVTNPVCLHCNRSICALRSDGETWICRDRAMIALLPEEINELLSLMHDALRIIISHLMPM